MDFLVIKDNVIINCIVADTLEIAKEVIGDKFEVLSLEDLKLQETIINNNDPENPIKIIPDITIGWFKDTNTNKWCSPKPDENYVWNELKQNWYIWVEEIEMYLLPIEYEGYLNGTWINGVWTFVTDN